MRFNEEINIGFLIAKRVSRSNDEEEVEVSVILDASEEDIKEARKALRSE